MVMQKAILPKYDGVLTRHYKNAEMEVIIEDDMITTIKAYIDGKCVYCPDVADNISYNRKNVETAFNDIRKEVDKQFAELLSRIWQVWHVIRIVRNENK